MNQLFYGNVNHSGAGVQMFFERAGKIHLLLVRDLHIGGFSSFGGGRQGVNKGPLYTATGELIEELFHCSHSKLVEKLNNQHIPHNKFDDEENLEVWARWIINPKRLEAIVDQEYATNSHFYTFIIRITEQELKLIRQAFFNSIPEVGTACPHDDSCCETDGLMEIPLDYLKIVLTRPERHPLPFNDEGIPIILTPWVQGRQQIDRNSTEADRQNRGMLRAKYGTQIRTYVQHVNGILNSNKPKQYLYHFNQNK